MIKVNAKLQFSVSPRAADLGGCESSRRGRRDSCGVSGRCDPGTKNCDLRWLRMASGSLVKVTWSLRSLQ